MQNWPSLWAWIPDTFLSAKNGDVVEITKTQIKCKSSVTAGKILVVGTGVGDVGSVVLRDRKHLADEGMVVVVMTLSAEDASLISGPDIITRGFVYVKESEYLLEELRRVVGDKAKIKASGGIRTLADAEKYIELGADRLGCSAGVQIMKEYK